MMLRRLLATCLAALPLLAAAQTPLGQPSLDEAKVQIWCATVRFVYDDAGRPALKSSVRCEGANLAALAASIRPDSLRVYSRLYQPIEGRGAIYRGKKDNPARLAALAKAIIGKLKSSAARRRDPARMARVAALETALTTYAVAGTPPGDVPAAMTPAAADTTIPPQGAAPDPVAAAEAAGRDAAGTAAPALPATGPGSLLNRFAAPLALILGILSVVLYGLLRLSLGRWTRQQRRETLGAKQAATTAHAAAAAASAAVADSAAAVKRAEALVLAAAPGASGAPAGASPDQLSPAQRLEVERLVSQRVDEELRWLHDQLPGLVAAAVAGPAEAAPAPGSAPPAGPAPEAAPENPARPAADDVQLD